MNSIPLTCAQFQSILPGETAAELLLPEFIKPRVGGGSVLRFERKEVSLKRFIRRRRELYREAASGRLLLSFHHVLSCVPAITGRTKQRISEPVITFQIDVIQRRNFGNFSSLAQSEIRMLTFLDRQFLAAFTFLSLPVSHTSTVNPQVVL